MNDEHKGALISPCGKYRYWLERMWDPGPPLVWVMLNPSTADAEKDDPTIRRVRGFTKREGYGAFVVVNVWALRATDPRDLHSRREAYEPENINHVTRIVMDRDVVVAWGGHVSVSPALQRVKMALWDAKSVRCLGLTKGQRAAGGARVNRQPRHPLMLRKDTPLEPWPPTGD
jgi:hypothetical protein